MARDALALQGEVARAIAAEIEVALTPSEEARLASARSVDPEAYAAYLRGHYFWNKRFALQWLQEWYKEDSPNMVYLKVDPAFDSIRSDPRFRDLLRRLKFPV